MKNLLILLALTFLSCTGTQKLNLNGGDNSIEIAILQMNDVYEIAGVDNGRQGDLSRVAYYYDKLKEKYPQAMLVISGDFINPSLIGTMKYNGERIKGRQMVEVLNACQLDLATFGNHEFDLDLDELQARMDESTFDWIATNVMVAGPDGDRPFVKHVDGRPEPIPEEYIRTFEDADGTVLKLGVFSTLTPVNKVDYVSYADPFDKALSTVRSLESKCDLAIGLTHLNIAEDIQLAEQVDNIPLFVGGHDHDNMLYKVNNVVIAKADANAKTIYQHIITVRKSGKVKVESTLIPMNDIVPKDTAVNAIIQKWNRILDENVKQVVDKPYEVIYVTGVPLDGRESTIRHRQSNMGSIFTEAMLQASANNASCAIMNSGAIRIDDEVEGEITAIDVFRALPFGGKILDVTISGELLIQILDYSESSAGSGGYLQYAGVVREPNNWAIDGVEIETSSQYNVALNDFLLAGYDMPFLTRETDGIIAIHEPADDQTDIRRDIRLAIIEYLKEL